MRRRGVRAPQGAADADGVSPVQWIANLLIKEGRLPPDYRVEDDPEYRQAKGLGSGPD